MFGAAGDGKTDDTEAVRKALRSGKNVSWGAGKTYVIKKVLTLSSKVKHNFNNCTLKKVGMQGQSMLQIDNVSDYTIENVNFEDDSKSRSGFIKGHNVHGLTIRNVKITAKSPYAKDKPGNWCMSLSGQDITKDNVHLDSSVAGKWADGIHLGYCENVSIKNSYFYTGDDCIAIHQHPNNTGALVNKKSRDITIDNCTLKSAMANGIRLGLTYKGNEDFSKVGIDNLHVTNCNIGDEEEGYAVRTEFPSGAKDMSFSNIVFEDCNFYGNPDKYYASIQLVGDVEKLSFKNCNFTRNKIGNNAYMYIKGKSVDFNNISVVDKGKNTDKNAVSYHTMLLKCDEVTIEGSDFLNKGNEYNRLVSIPYFKKLVFNDNKLETLKNCCAVTLANVNKENEITIRNNTIKNADTGILIYRVSNDVYPRFIDFKGNVFINCRKNNTDISKYPKA